MRKANVLDMFHGDNRERIPDFAKLLDEGVFAVIHKATQGVSMVDPKFVERSKAASDAGMPFYAYHFGTSSIAMEQVNHFLDVMSQGKDVAGGALDFEDNANPMTLAGAITFLHGCDLGQRFKTPIYGGNRIREKISPVKSVQAIFAQRLLWLAEYGPHERVPLPWTDANKVLWQFSETGNIGGIAGHVDLNYWPPDDADSLYAAWTQKGEESA